MAKRRSPPADEYAGYVTHPRYGRRPRFTGLNPAADFFQGVFLHWHSLEGCRIANTAVVADLSKQTPATVAVTHYYDIRRSCRRCRRPFIFFADEQRYWYEELGLPLEADCVCCVDCRREQRELKQNQRRYEELFHLDPRNLEENLEMVDCCLSLVAEGIFHERQLERMSGLLKRLEAEAPERVR